MVDPIVVADLLRKEGGRVCKATDTSMTAYVSSPGLRPDVKLATATKAGFETAITVPPTYGVFRVQALNSRGRVLSTSAAFAIGR